MATIPSNYEATVRLYYGENRSSVGGLIINMHRLCHFQKYDGEVEKWSDQKKQEFVRTASNTIIFLKKYFPLILLVLGIALLIAYGIAGGACSEGLLTLFKATGVCSILGAFFSFCYLQKQIYQQNPNPYASQEEIATAYDTLGVDRFTVDRSIIKQAYYRLMLRFHPDRNGGVDTNQQTQAITTAHTLVGAYLDRRGIPA